MQSRRAVLSALTASAVSCTEVRFVVSTSLVACWTASLKPGSALFWVVTWPVQVVALLSASLVSSWAFLYLQHERSIARGRVSKRQHVKVWRSHAAHSRFRFWIRWSRLASACWAVVSVANASVWMLCSPGIRWRGGTRTCDQV